MRALKSVMEETGRRLGSNGPPARRLVVLVKRNAKCEVAGKDGPTVLGVEAPKTLFPRGMLHSSVVAHILVQKFVLGVPHYRLEPHFEVLRVSLGVGEEHVVGIDNRGEEVRLLAGLALPLRAPFWLTSGAPQGLSEGRQAPQGGTRAGGEGPVSLRPPPSGTDCAYSV